MENKNLRKFNEKYYIKGTDPVGVIRKKGSDECISLLSIPDDELPEALKIIKEVMRYMGIE